jgi:transposase-like protein
MVRAAAMRPTPLAETALDAFVGGHEVKYEKAAQSLARDRDQLLTFYDFPAEHWKHLRTTNPIKSAFATVRHRTLRSKACLSNRTALAMVFKLVEAAQGSWRRLDGHGSLASADPRCDSSPTGIEVVPKKRPTLSPPSPPPDRSGHHQE